MLIKASAGGGGRGMRIVRGAGRPARRAGGGRVRGGLGVRRPGACSASRTWSAAVTSRCRCSPTALARSGPSASASAPSSAGTRRSSRSRRRRWPSGRRGCASGCSQAARAGRVGDRLRERGHRRVPGRRERPVLVPGDEHPAPGRAPGDRVHDRARPGRAAAADRGGRPLPAHDRRRPRGHAIEARLYAEDPAADWQPQSGPLHSFDVPGEPAEFRRWPIRPPRARGPGAAGAPAGLGVVAGSQVGVHYDPMLAKVIAWAADARAGGSSARAATLATARIHGLTTNRDLLVARAAAPGIPGRADRHGVLRHARPGALDRAAGGRRGGGTISAGRRAGRRRGAAARRPGARRAATGLAERAIASRSAPGTPGTTSVTGSTAAGWWSRAATTSGWCRCARTGWSWK